MGLGCPFGCWVVGLCLHEEVRVTSVLIIYQKKVINMTTICAISSLGEGLIIAGVVALLGLFGYFGNRLLETLRKLTEAIAELKTFSATFQEQLKSKDMMCQFWRAQQNDNYKHICKEVDELRNEVHKRKSVKKAVTDEEE